jgi:arabinofuranosyltransferase
VSPRPLVARILLWIELALVGAVLATQFPHWWAQRWVQDDAYVSFRYARNLVRGAGLVYNPGEPVEGYTNFLWTVLAAVPLARGAADPLPFMQTVSVGLWLATYGILTLLGVALWRRGLWAAPLALIPLAYHWSFNLWFFSGMETPLVTFCTVAAVCAVGLDPRRHWWSLGVASLAAVGLVLTRPDGIVVCGALAAAVVWLDGAWLWRERRWIRGLLLPALPLALILAPYEAWRVWFYGSWYPNTYYAKAAYLPYYGRGVRYLAHYVWIYRLWPFLPALLAALWIGRTGLARRFLIASSLAALAVGFYVVRLGGDFMEWRFLTPVSGVFYPALVIAAAVVGEWIGTRVWGRSAVGERGIPPGPSFSKEGIGSKAGIIAWVTGAATAGLMTWGTAASTPAAQTRSIADQETIALLRRYTDPGRYDWRAAAAAFDAVLPPETRIATTSAGVIPYFCDRHCLDLHGLTDPVIAHTPIDPNARGRMGHEHWVTDHNIMRSRGVDVVLEWADPNTYPRSVTTPPHEGGELVSVRLDDGRYVDFTLLNPDLRSRLTDPRLVFYEVTRIAARDALHELTAKLEGRTLVDRLDWGNEPDEQRHAFREQEPPNAPYDRSWHTKLLTYLPPLDRVRLEDHGRRIYGSAEWQVHDVRADRDLELLARIDHTGGAIYDLWVNGRLVPTPLVTPWRPNEWWGELYLTVPHALLVQGTNNMRLVRRTDSDRDAEFYYMWFVQDAADVG